MVGHCPTIPNPFDDIPMPEDSPGFYVFEWVDSIFLLDISFRTCFIQAEDQIIVAVPSKVAWNYLSGWFTVDILSTLPLDQLSEAL